MANRPRVARFTGAEALRLILQAQSDDENSSIDGDEPESDNDDDHISEMSDHSDIESEVPPVAAAPHADDQDLPARGAGRCRGRARGRGRGRERGRARGRGRGQNPLPQALQPDDQPVGNDDMPDQGRPYTGKNGTIWERNPPPAGRRRMQDIIRNTPGITNAARCDNIPSVFSFFITPEMVDLIALETNREARQKIRDWNDNHHENQKEQWKPVDGTEIKAVIGLCIIAGLYKNNHEPQASLWSQSDGRPVFKATMSRTRFRDILKYMRFDNRATRADRQAIDKLAAFRDIWTMFVVQLPKYYIPGTDLCVDEQLVAFRGRCSFRQYIPSKPSKYGIKIWWNCDAETCYPLKGDIYLGRQPGEQREVGQGARVVKDLTSPWYKSGRNVTADNFFTSVPLAEGLLNDGLTYVGTIRSNKPHVPDEMKANNRKEEHSSMFGFHDQLTLVSYVPARGKAVLALSTMHHDNSVSGDQQKPDIILHYNNTKSGVDNLDHLARMHTSRRKINRWPMVLFFNMVDIAGIAAFIIWLGNFPDWKSSEGSHRRRVFLRELGYELVKPHVEKRSQIPNLHSATREAMASIGVGPANRAEQPAVAAVPSKRKRLSPLGNCSAKMNDVEDATCLSGK
ncbi:piggyBac transposable element-derived protein 1-like [Lingula anatina]|uniref:PiggyBac transposable element-derived protein 1-like n=1 Tax=Lingula anatina TaxID=7574 RepID=A0A1S3JKT0_LINAN|nr:piggyBac transposable element-derived protein 1-like [Lingula anatina]|eukprot:XP_013411025.1 piggyBac transposable element-derived protein 1-like [Lingula anatina]